MVVRVGDDECGVIGPRVGPHYARVRIVVVHHVRVRGVDATGDPGQAGTTQALSKRAIATAASLAAEEDLANSTASSDL